MLLWFKLSLNSELTNNGRLYYFVLKSNETLKIEKLVAVAYVDLRDIIRTTRVMVSIGNIWLRVKD
jgi:hypothetical protein